MKVFRIIIPVNDIEKATKFYSFILNMPGNRVSPGRHYFLLDDIVIAVYDPAADGDVIGNGWKYHENQYVYIACKNLEDIHTRCLKSDAENVDAGISIMPWGERLFYMNDPFGTPLCFVDETTIYTG